MLALQKQPSHLAGLLVLVTVLLVTLGSLTPFSFDSSRITGPGSGAWCIGWPTPKAGDVATNLSVYIPVGASLMLLFVGRFQRFTACFWAVVLASGMSFALESVQSVIVSRYASWYDVLFNTAGAAGGACAMGLYRPVALGALDSFRDRLSRAPADTLARLTTLGILVYALLPFSFVSTASALSHSMRQTRMPILAAISAGRLIPEGPAARVGNGAVFSQAHILLAGGFLILGILTTLARREQIRRVEAVLAGAGAGALLAVLVEAVSIFCTQHVFDVHVLGVYVLAAGLGAILGGVVVLSRGRSEDAVVPLAGDRGSDGFDRGNDRLRLPTIVLVAFWAPPLVLGLVGVCRIVWGGVGGGSLPSRIQWRLFAGYFHEPFGVAVRSLAEAGFGFALLAWMAYAVASRLRRRSLQAQVLGLSLLAGLGLTVSAEGVPNVSHIVLGLLTATVVAAGWRYFANVDARIPAESGSVRGLSG